MLYTQLIQAKILVPPDVEENFITQKKFQWNNVSYDNTYLNLTVLPTLSCNFKCPYCIQTEQKGIRPSMDDNTEDELIKFIKKFGKIRYLILYWFGGEPLLEFSRMLSITEKVKQLSIPFTSTLITNGYLLNDEIVKELDNLKIKNVQITIDGPKEIHDTRRVLANSSEGTYDRIIKNIENLLNNSSAKCYIRVNVDKSNIQGFVNIYKLFTTQFDSIKLNVYPGIITDSPKANPHIDCQFNKNDEADFYIDLYKKYDIDFSHMFYPTQNKFGCLATSKNSFVIGPEGEVYKCWNDVGIKDMVVGSIFKSEWNSDLISKYMEGTTFFNDKECVKCFYFPVCDGGCANKRLRNKYFGEDVETCSKFKGRLKEFLEIYYERKNNL